MSNDGRNTTRFTPNFPASCPWVTSVGGTTHINPERAAGLSAGGFSNIFPCPGYQVEAVDDYLDQLGDRWKDLYNPEGRGFPDVAAQGMNFRVVHKGREISVGGTSASAPTVAGMIALINAARMNEGLPPLGFLNPLLYSDKGRQGLTDIEIGGSKGCNGLDNHSKLQSPKVSFASWNATAGWDPVTGLGTVNFGNMLEVVGVRR